MSQQEILQVLKNHPDKWFSTVDLRDYCSCNDNSIQTACAKLSMRGFVLHKVIQRKSGNSYRRNIRHYKHKPEELYYDG